MLDLFFDLRRGDMFLQMPGDFQSYMAIIVLNSGLFIPTTIRS
jgi:hypothetical protein